MNVTEVMGCFQEKARKERKHIVLPEGTEPRTVKAAGMVVREGYADVTLLGNQEAIRRVASEQGASLEKVKVIDPEKSPLLDGYVEKFMALRKGKCSGRDEALKCMKDPIYFGTMMVYTGEADGLVSGAEHSTAHTIRPALQIIKTAPGISTVSSAFLMVIPNCEYGEKGLFVFADCAVVPNPTADEMASIALASAQTARQLCGLSPRVAMLSFSTKGSAEHELVEKVKKATAIAKEKAPDLAIDGELQADAAIIPSVGKKKAPNSTIAGQANVLVFPDLQSGNIAYKLVERLAKASAIGPFLQGLKKPVNDLSRGCSVEDIVNVTTITAVQAAGV